MFDSKASIELSQLFVYELSSIISYDCVCHPVSAYNILLDELLNLLCHDCG